MGLTNEDIKQIAEKLKYDYNLPSFTQEEVFVLAFTAAFEYFKKLEEHDLYVKKETLQKYSWSPIIFTGKAPDKSLK